MIDIINPQTISLSAASSFTGNLVPILITLGIALVLFALLRFIDLWDKHRNQIKLDELEAKLEKLKRYANQQKRRTLRDAITMLDPKERKHLYSIWEDNAVVSRKALFKLNELEDRLRRAERGAELRWTESKIGEVKDAERKVFPQQFPSEKRRKKK